MRQLSQILGQCATSLFGHKRGAPLFVTAMCLALAAATPGTAQDRAGSGQQATPATIAFEAGGPEHYVVTQADIASYIGRLYLLEIENAQLRAALADARAKVDSADLTAKGVSVQQRIRQILGCAADAPIEWKAFAPPSPGESAPSPCPPATAPTKKD